MALCRTMNLKTSFTSLDNIVEHIVGEIKLLEQTGIDIGNGEFLKGTLICFTFDNLGGNSLFGFVESFGAHYFCRICEATKEQCFTLTSELPAKIRRIGAYDEQLRQVKNSTEKHVKGVKKDCLLNNINNFHILQNKTVDMMHDVLEGVVPTFLHQLFKYCIKKEFITESCLHRRIRDHNYGQLSKRNKPSAISLDKANLNQSASQNYCLMVNTPFILFFLKDVLNDIWICVESLLNTMQIIFSSSVTESDLVKLSEFIKKHLEKYIELFKKNLIPKQHHLTHYPSIIRTSGPVKNFWMMRMEAKHKFFTEHAKKIKSRVNICKSLAVVYNKNDFTAGIKIPQKKTPLMHTDIMQEVANHNLTIDNLVVINFFEYNSIEYRLGFMITDNCNFFEIKYIVSDNNNKFWFLCAPYMVEEFNEFCHSFDIKRDNYSTKLTLIPLEQLQNRNSYEKVFAAEKYS